MEAALKRFVSVAMALTLATALGQNVLLREDFNGEWSTLNPPPGWRIYFDVEGDTSFNDWHKAPDTSGRNRWPDNPTPYALLDSLPPEEQSVDSLISPPFDCRGLNVVQLRCSTYFRGSGGAMYFAALWGSVENGPFQYRIFDYYGRTIGPGVQEFPLAWAAGRNNCRLAWVFEGPSHLITSWAVDNVLVTGMSSDIDVGVTAVLAPTGQVESAAVIQPLVEVTNHGDPKASFPVHLYIGDHYHDSLLVESLPGHAVDTLAFAPWTAGRRLNQRITAYTLALGDIHPENDTLRDSVFVHIANVRPELIYAPTDTVDSGQTLLPRVRFQNNGMDTAVFYGYLRIGTDYVDSTYIDQFAPGDARDVSFAPWTPTAPGRQPVQAITAWSGDNYPGDDTLANAVFVRGQGFRDAAAIRILTPAGPVRESSTVFPRGSVKNNGVLPIDLRAGLRILLGDSLVYHDSVQLSLAPLQLDTIAFAAWTAWPPDTFRALLNVALEGDMDPTNDTCRSAGRVLAAFHDVGIGRIIAPRDTQIVGALVPSAWVVNYGSFAETFMASCRISRGPYIVYQESTAVLGLRAGESTRVRFPSWNATVGQFVCRCSTSLVGDANPGNDLRTGTFWVESLDIEPGWHEMTKVRAPSGKPVYHGGALLANMGNRTLYALKGNKTRDFVAYSITGDSWIVLEPLPAGASQKPVYKSGCLASDGGSWIYAIKGNNTDEFYRYDITQNSWLELPPVPLGTTGKKPKAGSKMVYVVEGDTGWCYLLKGYKNEFYRFNTVAGRWDTFLPPAPLGPSAKDKYKEGSFIAYDGDHTIYCVKSKYNELFAFDVIGDTWWTRSLLAFPRVGRSGRSKKTGDGAGGAFYGGEMFCLKGGNTQEFWKYTPATDSWHELDTLPQLGSTGAKKRVKGGGAITAAMPSVFYVFKGGKTDEFWRYRIPPPAPGVAEPSRTDAVQVPGTTTIVRRTLELPLLLSAQRLGLFDLSGRVVMPLAPGPNDVSGLAPGVYFIRALATAGRTSSTITKVIIQ